MKRRRRKKRGKDEEKGERNEEKGKKERRRGRYIAFSRIMNPHMPHTSPLHFPLLHPCTPPPNAYLALVSLTSLTLEKMTWCCLLSKTLLPSGSPGFIPGSSMK